MPRSAADGGTARQLRAIAHRHYTASAHADAPLEGAEHEALVTREVREMLDDEQRRAFDANVAAWRAGRGRDS